MPIRFMECMPNDAGHTPNPWRNPPDTGERLPGDQPLAKLPPQEMMRFQTRRERGWETACPPSTP
ncbi:MAG: hypothetical protein HQL96_10055 [Magnetococcales bacterium]|nr:hypothetical protein [Magnetococcales bacterium]